MTKVVLIHWGDNEFVRLAERQARKYNDVDLLLDPTPQPPSMEISRWFVLREHMLERKLQRCLYIDSDVLLYKDVDEDFRDCDMAFSASHCGHNMFINNRRILNEFCLYIEQHIFSTELIDRTRVRLPGNVFPDSIGDMVLLNNFMYNSKGFFRDTAKVVNGSVYDHNINTEGIPEMIKGVPYRENVRLNSIHFQGNAKIWMKKFVDEKSY